MSTTEERLTRLYAHIARDLSYRFDGVFAFEAVERVVAETRADLERRSRIKDFLPVLVENVALEHLRAAARPGYGGTPGPHEVLFVCSRSEGRSQLAAALTLNLGGPGVHVLTAGTVPSSAVQDEVLAVLAELGVPVDDVGPKPLTDELVRAADVVVTLGGGDACPLLPGRRYLDWDVLNPAGQDARTVRAIRADLESRVRVMVADLGI